MTIVNFLLLRSPSAASADSLPTPLSNDSTGQSVGVLVPLRNEAENVQGLISTLSE